MIYYLVMVSCLSTNKMLSMKISHINVGYGEDISIVELANLIKIF